MQKIILAFFFVFCCMLIRAQKLDPFFTKPITEYNLWNIKNFYKNNYKDLTTIEEKVQENSIILESKNENLYLINEIVRAQFLSISERKKEALKLLSKLELNKKVQTNYQINAFYHNVKGNISFDLKEKELTQKHYNKSLANFIKINDSISIKASYINLGNFSFSINLKDSALIFYTKALEIQNRGYKEFNVALYNGLGIFYEKNKNHEAALKIYQSLNNDSLHINDPYVYAAVSTNLAAVLCKTHNYGKAIELCKKVSEVCKENQMLDSYMEVERLKGAAYKELKKFELAYKAMYIADSLKQLIEKEKLNSYMAEIEKEKEKAILNADKKRLNDSLEYEKKRKNYITIILIIASIILIVTVFFTIRINKKKKLLADKYLALVEEKQPIKSKIPVENKEHKELLKKLELELNSKKVFLDEKLTLNTLAKKLKTNRSYLSETINTHYQISFSNLINKHRIKEASELLIDKNYQHYSIEGIAKTVGYRNISSFNSAFKKETGITPSYFRKSNPKN